MIFAARSGSHFAKVDLDAEYSRPTCSCGVWLGMAWPKRHVRFSIRRIRLHLGVKPPDAPLAIREVPIYQR